MYVSVPPYTYSDSPPRSTVSKQTIVVTSYMQWGRERGEEGKGGEGRGGEEVRNNRGGKGRVEGRTRGRKDRKKGENDTIDSLQAIL